MEEGSPRCREARHRATPASTLIRHTCTAARAIGGSWTIESAQGRRRSGLRGGFDSPYAASKVAATTYATLFRDLWDLRVVVLRLAMVYEPADPNTKRLVPHAIDSLLDDVAPALSTVTLGIEMLIQLREVVSSSLN